MNKLVYRGIAVLIAAGIATLAAPAAAFAESALGNDVSWPQCGTTLPTGQSFGIVGVNHGKANDSNSCFAAELTWAQGSNGSTSQPVASVYVNTGNPGLAASWWPDSNTTQHDGVHVANPRGTCAHTAGSSCAFVYGYSMAYDDVHTRLGALSVGDAAGLRFWLDVETGNTWSSDHSANSASLEGMAAYLDSIGAEVGLYSTASQWATIAGTTSSTASLAGLPSWLAGAGSSTGAKSDCTRAGLTPGSIVTLVQFVSNKLDYNVSCDAMAAAPTPTISGTLAVGKTLTAHAGTWQPSPVTLKYQWLRNSVAISGATGSTHKTTTSDAGKSITVRVTGSRSGNATTARVSAASVVGKVLTKTYTPKISGTGSAGHTLTAASGTWTPSPVAIDYQWVRNGVPIAGQTAKTYVLAAADKGKTIRVIVTGSKVGYTSVSKTSAGKVIAH